MTIELKGPDRLVFVAHIPHNAGKQARNPTLKKKSSPEKSGVEVWGGRASKKIVPEVHLLPACPVLGYSARVTA